MAGQTDFFLKIDGIEGESQDDKHRTKFTSRRSKWEGPTPGPAAPIKGRASARRMSMTSTSPRKSTNLRRTFFSIA